MIYYTATTLNMWHLLDFMRCNIIKRNVHNNFFLHNVFIIQKVLKYTKDIKNTLTAFLYSHNLLILFWKKSSLELYLHTHTKHFFSNKVNDTARYFIFLFSLNIHQVDYDTRRQKLC